MSARIASAIEVKLSSMNISSWYGIIFPVIRKKKSDDNDSRYSIYEYGESCATRIEFLACKNCVIRVIYESFFFRKMIRYGL